MTLINKKCTWNDIVKQYPNTWVGLTNIIWKDESNVDNATLVAISDNADELLCMQADKKISLVEYTTPDNCCQLGLIVVV